MAYDPRASFVDRDPPDRPPRRRGLHVGPVAITPTRVFLLIALLGSTVYAIFAAQAPIPDQLPALTTGAALLGIVFAALAIVGVAETLRASRAGLAGRSVVAAVFGGIAGIIAFGCFAAAILLFLLARANG